MAYSLMAHGLQPHGYGYLDHGYGYLDHGYGYLGTLDHGYLPVYYWILTLYLGTRAQIDIHTRCRTAAGQYRVRCSGCTMVQGTYKRVKYGPNSIK